MGTNNNKFSKLREKADMILLNGGGPDNSVYTNDLETLVQELNIYQIELEQQNEELIHTQFELEKSRQRFSDLFDHAPFSYFLIFDNYQIVNLNATACKFLGGDKGDFINQKISKDKKQCATNLVPAKSMTEKKQQKGMAWGGKQ